METILQARRRHRAVALASIENESRAADLWHAVSGIQVGLKGGTFAEAVSDTASPEHAALLAVDGVASGTAFSILWNRSRRVHAAASPFQLRDIARGGWEEFDQEAGKVRELADGFGWDLGAAWTQTRDVQLAQGDMGQVERIARLAGRMFVALRGARAAPVN